MRLVDHDESKPDLDEWVSKKKLVISELARIKKKYELEFEEEHDIKKYYELVSEAKENIQKVEAMINRGGISNHRMNAVAANMRLKVKHILEKAQKILFEINEIEKKETLFTENLGKNS